MLSKQLRLAILISVVAVILTSSCMQLYVNGAGATKPVSLTPDAEKPYNVVKHFREDARGWFILWGADTVVPT